MNSLDSKKSHNKLILYVCVSVVLLVITFFLGRCSVKSIEGEIKIKTDTTIITKTDTLWRTKMMISSVPKLIKVLDTLYVHDTILLREQKKYEDTVATIWVSGIDPELDSVHYYLPTKEVIVEKTIERTIKKKSGWVFNLGIYAGAGTAIKDGQLIISPEVGIGGSIGWGWMIETKK